MAVYTDVAADELADFLKNYEIGELLSYKGIAEGVENSNFLLHTTSGSFILTLYEKRVAKGDLPFFLRLMTHLASRGVNCPQPVKDKSGEALRMLAGRPAAIITFLEGIWPRKPNASHCAGVGKAITLDGKRYTVLGVMPRAFNYPTSVQICSRITLKSGYRSWRSTPTSPPTSLRTS